MRKLFILLFAALPCFTAIAQENDGKEWSPSGWSAVTYNYYLNVPDGMLSSGVGLDFCLFEYQINPHSNTIFSVGLLDFIFDWRFLKTDLQFADDGSVGPIQIKDANATLFDLGFSFPIGITQRLGRNISASLFAAPGIAWVNYRNTYSTDLVKHSDTFTARKGGAGFRLDVKAAVWFDFGGVFLRYQPIAFTPKGQEKKVQTISAGLAFRF